MALSILHSWVAAEVLYAADLVAEFNNIYNNSLSLVSPWTGSMDANNQSLTNLDELLFRNAATTASAVGRLRRNGNNLNWHDRIGSVALQPLLGGGIFGLTMSNGTDAVNDIDIAAGVAVDNVPGTVLRLTSGITKQLDAAWAVGTNAGGLDTGSIANTTYHVYVIQRPDTGVVDAIFSTSAAAPTYPANYTLSRRIGSIVRTGGTIKAFTQDGDYFIWTASVLDVNANNPGTTAVARTLTVPTGINVFAIVNWGIVDTGSGPTRVYVTDPSANDEAPSSTVAPLASFTSPKIAGNDVQAQIVTRTNTSAQNRVRQDNSGAGVTLYGATLGYIDRRKKDA